jgi:hypothetical protein
MRTLSGFVVASLLFTLCRTPAAYAQDPNARAAARTLAQEGASLYEKNDFQGALDKFKRAYEQFPSPKLFLNIGQALRGLSRHVDALESFERFLAEAKEASPEYQEQASAQVAELKGKLARVAIDCNRPGAVVSMDGENRGTIPLPKPLMVEPGAHALTLTADGDYATVNFTAEAGQEVSRVVTFAEKKQQPEPVIATPKPEPVVLLPVQAPQAPAENPQARKHTWYWIAGGAIVAAATTTLIVLYGQSDHYPTTSLGTRTLP